MQPPPNDDADSPKKDEQKKKCYTFAKCFDHITSLKIPTVLGKMIIVASDHQNP